MKQLTINRARALGRDMNAKGIAILAFGDDGEFQACSYGRTKQDCGQIGRWLDRIYEAIDSGEVADPFAEQQFAEQQSPSRSAGPSGAASVSSDPPSDIPNGEVREASRPLPPECSICRRRHGREVVHACE
jgi:hypothetical protein